ncbi:hypothetical protein AB8O53_16030 [Streptomyces pilosus]
MLDPHVLRVRHAVTVRGSTPGLTDEIAIPTGQDPQAVSGEIYAFVEELVTGGVIVDTTRLSTITIRA